MPERFECPVCAKRAALFDVVDFNKCCEEDRGKFLPLSGVPVYYALCGDCGYLFAPEFLGWSRADFVEKIYNDAYVEVDPEFEEIRPAQSAKVLTEMFGAHKGRFSHLDYGGGDGRLSRLLAADGWRSRSYDPFFDPATTLGGEKFDLITVFEVFEHVPRPHEMMRQIAAAAHDETFIFFSTFAHDSAIRRGERINWWYVAPRNGHVGIFSKNSLALLGRTYGYQWGTFTDYLHCYCKTVPAWAQHLMV
jgi:hypothetical protein